MSLPIKPLGSIADFLDIRAQSPLLDLEHLFGFNLEDYRKHVLSFQASVRAGMSFAAYRRVIAQRRPSKISQWLETVTAADDRAKRDRILEDSFEYVMHLRPTDVSTRKLDAHYTLLTTHLEKTLEEDTAEGVAGLGEALFPWYFGPVLKWVHGNSKRATAHFTLGIIEELLRTIQKHAPHRFSARILELRNQLQFVYLSVAFLFEQEIMAIHVAQHLRLIRVASSVSWSELPTRLRIQYGALALHMAMLFYSLEEPFEGRLGFSLNTLGDLSAALADAAGATAETPLAIHQWVFRTMQEKLDLDVFSTRTLSKKNPNALTTLSHGEQLAAAELVKMFSGFRIPITADSLGRFLLQFGNTRRIRGALKLLTHTRFFPYWELAEGIQGILEAEIANGARRLVLAPLGDRTGSTSIINYLAKHSSLAPNLVFADDIRQALNLTHDNESIYFVDDCVLSGTQTLAIIGDLLGTREQKAHHTRYAEPLSTAERARFEKRSSVLVYCIACDYALKRMEAELPSVGLDTARVTFRYAGLEPLTARAFGPMSPVAWSSVAERDELKKFAAEVGYDILATRAARKGWSDERRRESALGYSDFQRLLVFPYGVPKSSLTLLWESGHETRSWDPLFPGQE